MPSSEQSDRRSEATIRIRRAARFLSSRGRSALVRAQRRRAGEILRSRRIDRPEATTTASEGGESARLSRCRGFHPRADPACAQAGRPVVDQVLPRIPPARCRPAKMHARSDEREACRCARPPKAGLRGLPPRPRDALRALDLGGRAVFACRPHRRGGRGTTSLSQIFGGCGYAFSPARMRTLSRFSAGGSGQVVKGLNAQGGL